ncbi:ABC transporter substrate-binding protein [Rhodococcus triatomae]|uniref:Iron complex transport system substrate-binding protein n=1 Tax=Rhodococcus triatomae TaxID=300028 RepID=A0A1G8AZ85_9NOCA|nr:ABC transporter substrate-binding protein [Rhodococcus triatomae]QNG17644.1 ABC transporter substrate-binding protein [Rhodococcus triatomae]QNG22689.1 ABC transporter substrate-binding protein [Rhodococcus triatomae]SDH25680.1 iron complex transport system substrate-binding protein [Rhodococcus triatomae]
MHAFLRRTAVTTAALLAVAGCSTGSSEVDEPSSPGGSHSHFPLTLENCGREVTIDAPPERAVSLNQGSTEILLSLGLADRMVGTATWTDPVRENLAADNRTVPRLADDKPSLEVVLDTEPDFVSASFGGTLGPGGVADRDLFDQLGVPTYLSPTDCDGKTSDSVNADGARTEPLTMDTIHREIRDLAAIFDVRERGEEFVAELRERFDAAARGIAAAGTSLGFWFADLRTPYMAECCGSSGIITESVGASNVFADTTDEWPQVSWETILDRDPTALVLADLSRRSIEGDALESKIAFLESDPVASQLTAVREGRYIVIHGADLNPSIRTVDGIEKTAAALRDWEMDG